MLKSAVWPSFGASATYAPAHFTSHSALGDAVAWHNKTFTSSVTTPYSWYCLAWLATIRNQ